MASRIFMRILAAAQLDDCRSKGVSQVRSLNTYNVFRRKEDGLNCGELTRDV